MVEFIITVAAVITSLYIVLKFLVKKEDDIDSDEDKSDWVC